jgi:hypothetical protein
VALLSRRRAQASEDDTVSSTSSFPDTVATSPTSETAPDWRPGASESRRVESESGHTMVKEPASYFEWGLRVPAPRSQSFSVAVRSTEDRPVAIVLRQPYGPPGSPDSLKQKNFAANIRRQAGLNLGMLNRRIGIESAEM